jgi:Uma2 family endonuclease
VMVACGPEGEDPLVEDDPCLIVEVASLSSETTDHRPARKACGL